MHDPVGKSHIHEEVMSTLQFFLRKMFGRMPAASNEATRRMVMAQAMKRFLDLLLGMAAAVLFVEIGRAHV